MAARTPSRTPATTGGRFVRHVRTTRWYRSKLADRIPRRHTVLRPLAHLTLGAVKVAGYVAAGAGLGVVEGTRRVAPHVHRHVRRQLRPKWTNTAPGTRAGLKIRHHLACACGDTFSSLDDLNKHHSDTHHGEDRAPRARPTVHTVYAGRHAGRIKVRPVPGTPHGRHRATPARPPTRRAAATFTERHRRAIAERGKKVMADTNSEASRVARAWADVGDALPRGTEDAMDLFVGLAVAASEKAEHVRALQATLLKRLNMDPTVVHGLSAIADAADLEAVLWTAVMNTTEHVYGPYLALIRSGVTVPHR